MWQVTDTLVCKPESDGWLVWFRRLDDTVHFNRSWEEYVSGFGDPGGNYWIGLDTLSLITGSDTNYTLRVEISSSVAGEWFDYKSFAVGNVSTNYTLLVQSPSSANFMAKSYLAMEILDGQQFSTWDRDNDEKLLENCSQSRGGDGGWWFRECAYMYVTNVYSQMYLISTDVEGKVDITSVVMKLKPIGPL